MLFMFVVMFFRERGEMMGRWGDDYRDNSQQGRRRGRPGPGTRHRVGWLCLRFTTVELPCASGCTARHDGGALRERAGGYGGMAWRWC